MTQHDPTLDQLRRIPALRAQKDRALRALAPLVDHADIPAGHRLTSEGSVGAEMFIVIDGQADVYIDGELVAEAGPGDFIGEMAMLDRGPRSATVRARTPMRVLVVGPSAFASFVEHGGVARAMASKLANRLRQADNTLATAQRPTRQDR
jgi:CRP-like cAMP-binding protein